MIEAMRVQVYWNLHKKCWSIRDKKTGRVVRHADSLCLARAIFHVSQAGRDRVRREKCKNVHAWVEGEESSVQAVPVELVTYNPYKHDTFVKAQTGAPLLTASCVVFHSNGKVTAEGGV